MNSIKNAQMSPSKLEEKKVNHLNGKHSQLSNGSLKTILSEAEKLRGKFGWARVADIDMPYIFRLDGKYCAARIVEGQLLKRYELLLHREIYCCARVKCWQMTRAEAQLFNEINVYHCDGIYGSAYFSESDILIKLEDVEQFHCFLSTCYYKLSNINKENTKKCGFIKINDDSIVPYTIIHGGMYLPLFYFEGEVDDVKPCATEIRGWDLAYLKFCCKTQGIKNALYDHEACDVVSIDVIKKHFPGDTKFEEYWPNKIVNDLLLTRNITQTQISNNDKTKFVRCGSAQIAPVKNQGIGQTGVQSQKIVPTPTFANKNGLHQVNCNVK